MKIPALMVVLLTGGLLIYAAGDFPQWADPSAPAHQHVSPYYLENGAAQTGAPNIVTAVLADYRGYDTMFETAVIFSAGVVCFLLLRVSQREDRRELTYRHRIVGMTIRVTAGLDSPPVLEEFERLDRHWTPQDLIIRNGCRLLIPFIQLFALYVIAHGHHSPGGGFQGGVILGASFILLAISFDLRTALERMQEKVHGILGPVGVLIYAGTGALCLLLGSNFLDYGALAPLIGGDKVMARSHGILIVEIGVGIGVMATMIWIYNNVSSRGRYEEGL